MRSAIIELQDVQFDVVIIGAGVSGAFLAWELSRRGIKVALLEKGDFGGFTSSASSKLLHGGLRYLQQFKFGKVYESARERARFINFSPNIPKYIPFVVPTFNTGLMKSRLVLQAGMFLYDLICVWPNRKIFDHLKKPPHSYFYKKTKLINKIPLFEGVAGLTGGQFFYEAHMHSSERMTFSLIKAAESCGACVLNYVEVKSFCEKGGRVNGLECEDGLSGKNFTVRCDVVANAAGPHLPQLNRLIGARLSFDTTGYSKGMHLVTRQLEPHHALALVTRMKNDAKMSRGGRHIFIIPWRGRSLIGTTNVPFSSKNLNEITVSEIEIKEFIREINSALPRATLTREDVYYAYAGLYPLISEEVLSDTYQGTGEYQIIDHAQQDGIDGLVSVMGAKFTTAGKTANLAMKVILTKLTNTAKHEGLGLSEVPECWKTESCKELQQRLYNGCQSLVSESTVFHLVTNYGQAAEEIIKRVIREPRMAAPLAEERENILAELFHCIEQEMICHLDDFIFRRTGMGTIGHPGQQCLMRCVGVLSEHYNWSDADVTDELARVESYYCYEG